MIKTIFSFFKKKKELSWIDNNLSDYPIDRIEVIDKKGRSYVNMNVKYFFINIQDENKTLKIFIRE